MTAERLLTATGQPVQGPLLITPQVFADERGFFFESWNERCFRNDLMNDGVSAAEVECLQFRQDNHSRSSRGVLRGLHFQLLPEPQGKLVRCSVGSIFDVAVDLRSASPTYGQWVGTTLSADNHQQFWVPMGFAHGFLTLSDVAEVQYKASGFWNRDCERSLRWNDSTLAIQWPLQLAEVIEPLLTEKDAQAPMLSMLESMGEVFE